MTQDDLTRIERRLGLSLPETYRATMLRYPFEGKPYASDCELPNDPELLIQSNEYLRQHGFFGEPWPNQYFSFGGDGAGNEYFFDLSEEPLRVWFADHEGEAYTVTDASFDAWLADRAREYEEWEEDERRREERKRNKKWWQF